MSDKISTDEAISRGYEYVQCGWNHRLNQPIIAQIRQMKSFLIFGISVPELERVRLLVEGPPEPEPAADIPMEARAK